MVLTGPFCPLFSAGQTFDTRPPWVSRRRHVTWDIHQPWRSSSQRGRTSHSSRISIARRGTWLDGCGCFPIWFSCETNWSPFKGSSKKISLQFDSNVVDVFWRMPWGLLNGQNGGDKFPGFSNCSGGEVTWQRWWRWCMRTHSLNGHQMLRAVWENKVFY